MDALSPAAHPGGPRQADIDAALLLLDRLGLSPADLAAIPRDQPPVPTFAEYIPVVSAAVSAGTRRAYGSYWNRVLDQWADRRLDEPAASEIRLLMTHVVARRNARGGRSAAEHLIAALRCLYRHAEDDGLTIAWMAGSLNNHVDRRTVMQLASTLIAAPLLGVEEPTERLAYALMGPVSLQDDTVTFLEQRTIGLHQIEQMFPARIVHRSVMSHLREVTALLEGHPDDPLRQRLARIAGESANLAGWTAWDLGEGAHSAQMYRITEAAARVAGDPVIMACVNADRSGVTSGPAAHEDARRLLVQARECLPGRGEDATRAFVLGREAEEAAAIGDKAAKDLIKQAAEAFARARPQHERPSIRFLDQTRMSALELSTYTRLGDEQKVHGLTEDLLATITPASKRAALVYADVGIAAVRLGDVSNGISYGRLSLEAARASEARSRLGRLDELAQALAQEPKARELRAEIRQAHQALASPR